MATNALAGQGGDDVLEKLPACTFGQSVSSAPRCPVPGIPLRARIRQVWDAVSSRHSNTKRRARDSASNEQQEPCVELHSTYQEYADADNAVPVTREG